MLRSIKSRLTLLYVAILAVILVLFSASLYATTRREQLNDLDRSLAQQSTAFAEFFFRNPKAEEVDQYLGAADALAAVYDPEGRTLYRSKPLRAVRGLDRDQLREGIREEGVRRFWVGRASAAAGGQVLIAFGRDATEIRARLNRLLGYFALFVPVVLLLSWYLGYLFVSGSLAPVEEIRRRAERLSRENLSERVPLPRTRGELRELAATFNGMLERLERTFLQTQAFTANASHELKTPLANLRTEIELALERDAPAEEYHRLLASVVEEVSRMTHVVENLLLLAQLDRGAGALAKAPVDLSRTAREAVADMQIMGETRGVTVREGVIAPGVRVTGDEGMLRRVVMNLLENGVKYNREGGEVKCSVWTEDAASKLEVSDNGPGIPEEAVPHLFERFYRVDKGRGGTGLGLSICKSLVEAHGGRIEVRSREGAGTTFVVTVPGRNGAA